MIPTFRSLPRPTARRARRSRARLRVALLALLALSWLVPGQARAQTCVRDDQDPLVVTCSGLVEEGFDAGADDGVQLTVTNGAVMENGAETDTIRLNDDSLAVIETGADVSNDAAGGAALSLLDDGVVSHAGTINVLGVRGTGILVQDRGSLLTSADSTIVLEGENSIGIRVRDDSLNVNTDGLITGTAVGSIGIFVGSDNPVLNTGTIELDGADARGVLLGGSGNQMSHSGSITMRGAGAWGVAVGTGSTLTSLGSIAVEGDASVGVLLGADATLNILSGGEISAMGDGSVGVLAGGGTVGTTILNLGTITVGPGGGPAVSFAFSGPGPTANLLESLTDSVIDAGVGGIAVLGSEAREIFTSSGQVIGQVDLAGGDDVLQLLEEAVLDSPADLGSGSDILQLNGGGIFDFVDGGAGVGIDAILLDTGVLTEDTLDLAKIDGFEALDLFAGVWTLQGSASFSERIELTGGVLRIADPVFLSGDMEVSSSLALSDTLELTGDYTQRPLSVFSVALGSEGSDGLLDVIGAASIEDGAVLGILEENPLSGSFTIMTASGGITGTFSDLPEPTPVLSFSLTNTGNELVLDIVRRLYVEGATTPNQIAVAGNLDDVLAAGPGEEMQELLGALDRVSFADYGAALDSLHPEAYDAQTSAMLGFGYTFARLAASNLFECAPSYYPYLPTWITSGPPCAKDGWTPWIGAFGSFADRSGGSGHVDYSGQGGGVAVGAGRSFGPDWEVSGYVGSGFGWLDVSGVGDGSLQTLEVGVGAVRRIGPFSLRGVLDYGHGWHQQDRRVVLASFDQTPSGEYESNRVTGLLEGAWQLVAAETNFFEPVASLDFTWL
ncbi:MAG: autotransporter outer membrane beta-barrel domain-containing protein, partial [Thermoanaerobaculia bacterium]|nr:autotransporter outer membrane beta-barrel domain-containing protein [Thermoanaerobaculia bacterium]